MSLLELLNYYQTLYEEIWELLPLSHNLQRFANICFLLFFISVLHSRTIVSFLLLNLVDLKLHRKDNLNSHESKCWAGLTLPLPSTLIPKDKMLPTSNWIWATLNDTISFFFFSFSFFFSFFEGDYYWVRFKWKLERKLCYLYWKNIIIGKYDC